MHMFMRSFLDVLETNMFRTMTTFRRENLVMSLPLPQSFKLIRSISPFLYIFIILLYLYMFVLVCLFTLFSCLCVCVSSVFYLSSLVSFIVAFSFPSVFKQAK
eukprot:1051988_1